jgi:hypothetical protein
MSTPDIYQFHVWLRGISPMIWRRLLLRSDQTLADLHYTLQIAFGWSDFHLHRFRIHGQDFGVPRRVGLSFHASAQQVHLAEFHFRLGERFLYEYDFGDQWEHQIRLERILPLPPKQTCPVCVGGKRSGPPEDCGGVAAFQQQRDAEHVNNNETRGVKVYGVLSCLAAGGLIQTAFGKEGCCGGRLTNCSG